jgi:hypothetical protein
MRCAITVWLAAEVEERHAAVAQRVGHRGDDEVAQLLLEVIDRVHAPRTDDLAVELFDVGHLVAVHAVRAHAHHAELAVADRHRLRGAPTTPQLQARGEEDHVRLERRFEQLVPVLQRGEYR